MKIENYTTKENGDTHFLVDGSKYERILKHLSSKGIPAGGHYSEDISDISVGCPIDKVNEALADFGE